MTADEGLDRSGYIRKGRENGATDNKETYEAGWTEDMEIEKKWPQEEDLPGFRATMLEFHEKAHELNLALMKLLAIALGLEQDYFLQFLSERANNLRMLHYPQTARNGQQSRLIPHTDDGSITLLWQDDTGGLEVMTPDGSECHSPSYHPSFTAC